MGEQKVMQLGLQKRLNKLYNWQHECRMIMLHHWLLVTPAADDLVRLVNYTENSRHHEHGLHLVLQIVLPGL
jgi:hypothetical protein